MAIVPTAVVKLLVTVDPQGNVSMNIGRKKIVLKNLTPEDAQALRDMAASGHDAHETVDTASLSDVKFISGHRLNSLSDKMLNDCRPEDLKKHRKVLALADRCGLDSYDEALKIAGHLYLSGS